MKQRQLVLKQSSVADVWPLDSARWQSPQNYTPVIRVTMELAWPQQQKAKRRRTTKSQALTFLSLAAGFFLAFAIVFLGSSYLSSVLIKRIQSLPPYNQPQAQYSDVWRWRKNR